MESGSYVPGSDCVRKVTAYFMRQQPPILPDISDFSVLSVVAAFILSVKQVDWVGGGAVKVVIAVVADVASFVAGSARTSVESAVTARAAVMTCFSFMLLGITSIGL